MENIVILSTNEKKIGNLKDGVPTSDVSINMQYRTKMAGMDIHLKEELNKLYANLIHNDCEMEKRILESYLHIAATDPIEFAYIYNKGPGATAITAGEVVHIAKCVPIVVSLLSSKTCYKEMPVKHMNKTMFVNPRTRILQDVGSEVPCSTLFGIHIREMGIWYTIYPDVQAVKSPRMLESHINMSWEYESMEKIINRGLYTNEQIEKAQSAIMQPYREDSVSSTWTMQVWSTEYASGKIRIDQMISQDIINDWLNNAWSSAWGFFNRIGNFFTTT